MQALVGYANDLRHEWEDLNAKAEAQGLDKTERRRRDAVQEIRRKIREGIGDYYPLAWLAQRGFLRPTRSPGRPPYCGSTTALLRERLADEAGLQVVDVRRPAEYGSGHVPGAVNVPLDTLADAALGLDSHKPTAVVCAGGYRSAAGASLLLRRGFTSVLNVLGGTAAWVDAGFATEPDPPAGRA